MDLGFTDSCANSLNGAAQQLFATLIHALFVSQCKLAPEGRYPPNYASQLQNGEEFDFIVVGAGSAGSLLANRLSAVSEWRILLIEAGNYPSVLTEIPAQFLSIQSTEEDWQYKTQPNENYCSGLKDNICLYPRGKVLGGSSAINAMLYLRSSENDHENWVNGGNPDWDYQSALKNYKKFENVEGEINDDYGKGGELNISISYTETPLRDLLIRTYQEMGYEKVSDSAKVGYEDAHVTISNGRRISSAKAFLEKIGQRPNLHIALNAQVSKLLFEQNQVNGVQIRVNQQIMTIKAKKEVILSAGAIGSPQILMNSGIGPKEHLDSLGIPVKHNLRVGENFQDHPIYLGLFVNIDENLFPEKSEKEEIDDIYQYVMHKKGVLSIFPLVNFLLHATTKSDNAFRNIQINHLCFNKNNPNMLNVLLSAFNFHPDLRNIIINNNKNTSNMIFFPKLLNSRSTGKILLRSTDPFDQPLIYPNYMSEEEDIGNMLASIKLIQEILVTKSFSEANPELVNLQLPKCKEHQYNTENYWRCALRNYVTHLHHPSGTCKMGPESDPQAVVSTNLKVHGVNRVRVIDASIMPTITSCNTNAPTYMIAEKGAEMVIKEWLHKHTEL